MKGKSERNFFFGVFNFDSVRITTLNLPIAHTPVWWLGLHLVVEAAQLSQSWLRLGDQWLGKGEY